jgi:hypothetical protein
MPVGRTPADFLGPWFSAVPPPASRLLPPLLYSYPCSRSRSRSERNPPNSEQAEGNSVGLPPPLHRTTNASNSPPQTFGMFHGVSL